LVLIDCDVDTAGKTSNSVAKGIKFSLEKIGLNTHIVDDVWT
jgi:hypothetical protein